MSAAHRLPEPDSSPLTHQRGGQHPSLRLPMLPIRQTLSALPVLKAGPKAVLIEVCELAERGDKGYCNARNEHFEERLGAVERTITRALALLVDRGLLLSDGQGKARRLVVAPALRACYTARSEAERRAAVDALNLDKNDAQPRQNGEVGEVANLDKSGHEPRQKWSTNLDKNGVEPRQNWSRVYGDEQDEQVDEQDEHPQTPEGWVRVEVVEGLKKKITDLEFELAVLKAKKNTAPTPVAAPPAPAAPRLGSVEPCLVAGTEESRALAVEMATYWLIPQGNARRQAQFATFTRTLNAAGRLVEVRTQFEAYRRYQQLRGLSRYAIEKYLGHELEGYADGEWCGSEWPALLAEAQQQTKKSFGPDETPERASFSRSKVQSNR